MGAEAFLDTNILVYAFDPSSPAKQTRALELLRADDWVVSWQILQEFASVALHRFTVPIKEDDLADYFEWVLMPRCRVMPGPAIYRQALEIRKKTGYRFYDSLVVSSALASGARVLFSEDLQHGRKIGDLTISNPFRES